MKKIFIISNNTTKERKEICNILARNGENVIIKTSSPSWEGLEIGTKLVLIENKLSHRQEFVPVYDDSPILSPYRLVRWVETETYIHGSMGFRKRKSFEKVGTFSHYKMRKGSLVKLDNHHHYSGVYLTECTLLKKMSTVSDAVPVYGIGLEEDGSLYAATSLKTTSKISALESVAEILEIKLSLRQQFIAAHARGGNEEIYNFGRKLGIPEEIIKEVVDNIDYL